MLNGSVHNTAGDVVRPPGMESSCDYSIRTSGHVTRGCPPALHHKKEYNPACCELIQCSLELDELIGTAIT